MKKLLILFSCIIGIIHAEALVINEILSNPVGDDSGREWIEVYNNGSQAVDLSSLTVSIKGATPLVVTPISGGVLLPVGGYAIIGSVVSGATKFLQDYPAYTGPLFKSSLSLVNTGVTSIDIRLQGVVVDTLSSYTAAKEGQTLSLVSGSFVAGTPTPGADNQVLLSDTNTTSTQTATTTETQVTISQMSPPTADIVLYMPFEKTVVAGAETDFSVFAMNRAGKPIDAATYLWAFGDGGQATGSTTKYRYLYPGRYIIQVEGGNGYVLGDAHTFVRVVAPEIIITGVLSGKYGNVITINNPNTYNISLSGWKLSINGALFSFPKNTILLGNEVTSISGFAMGFASTTISSSMVIKLLFPNYEEMTRYTVEQKETTQTRVVLGTSTMLTPLPKKSQDATPQRVILSRSQKITEVVATSSVHSSPQKDTRIASFIKNLFSH
jgi:hypothetical protein